MPLRNSVRRPTRSSATPIYGKAAEQFEQDRSLTGVDVRSSPMSSTRKAADVIFSNTNRNTDFTDKFCVRVDVTGECPFLVAKTSIYYGRETGRGR